MNNCDVKGPDLTLQHKLVSLICFYHTKMMKNNIKFCAILSENSVLHQRMCGV